MSSFIQVLTTTDRRELADAIARHLIAKRLAACVQIVGPITSVYRWQGQIETSQEWQLWIKTQQERFDELSAAIAALHTYEVPELIVVPIVAGSEKYLSWLRAETEAPKNDE